MTSCEWGKAKSVRGQRGHQAGRAACAAGGLPGWRAVHRGGTGQPGCAWLRLTCCPCAVACPARAAGAQCAHAAVGLVEKLNEGGGRHEALLRQWEYCGQAKICLKAQDSQELVRRAALRVGEALWAGRGRARVLKFAVAGSSGSRGPPLFAALASRALQEGRHKLELQLSDSPNPPPAPPSAPAPAARAGGVRQGVGAANLSGAGRRPDAGGARQPHGAGHRARPPQPGGRHHGPPAPALTLGLHSAALPPGCSRHAAALVQRGTLVLGCIVASMLLYAPCRACNMIGLPEAADPKRAQEPRTGGGG